MSRQDELEQLCTYYKQLARLWETACHDFRAFADSKLGDPGTYKKAVAFAAQRPDIDDP